MNTTSFGEVLGNGALANEFTGTGVGNDALVTLGAIVVARGQRRLAAVRRA